MKLYQQHIKIVKDSSFQVFLSYGGRHVYWQNCCVMLTQMYNVVKGLFHFNTDINLLSTAVVYFTPENFFRLCQVSNQNKIFDYRNR